MADDFADIEFMDKYDADEISKAKWNCVKAKVGEDIWTKWFLAAHGTGGWPNKPWDPIPF